MAGTPPPGPPKLGYKGKREREQEERLKREQETREQERDQERFQQQDQQPEREQELEDEELRHLESEAEQRKRFGSEQRVREDAKRERYLTARKVAKGVPRALYGGAVPGDPSTAQPPADRARRPAVGAVGAVGATAKPPRPPAPGGPVTTELPSGEVVTAVAVVEEKAAPATPPRRRLPPRPPKSPDMRPVWAGFILAGVGTTQLLWGIYTMARAPWVGEGRWADAVEWASFAAGFSAAVLGGFALRGGLWSFRKERYDRVKWGAVCATICMWALWLPWVVGFIALLIVHAAKDEYYPNYDPARDAPEWATPPGNGTGNGRPDEGGEGRPEGSVAVGGAEG